MMLSWKSSCAPCYRGALRSFSRPNSPLLVKLPSWYQLHRSHTRLSSTSADNVTTTRSLSVPSSSRFNDIGVQQLSDHVHAQVFPNKGRIPDPELVALSKDHLARHELLGKSQNGAGPVAFDLPALKGQTLDEHFLQTWNGFFRTLPILGQIICGSQLSTQTAQMGQAQWMDEIPY